MPNYEYRCSVCSKTFDRYRQVSNRKNPIFCPRCENPATLNTAPQDSATSDGRPNLKNVFRKV